jgi:hypothetical protein
MNVRTTRNWGVEVEDTEWPAIVDGAQDYEHVRVTFLIGDRKRRETLRVTRRLRIGDRAPEDAIEIARDYLHWTFRPFADHTPLWRPSEKSLREIVPDPLDPSTL